MNLDVEIKTICHNQVGIFTKRSFVVGEIVIYGKIEKYLSQNNSHASQIGENQFVLHDIYTRSVNHSCSPNCGIQLSSMNSPAYDFVAMMDIPANSQILSDYDMRNWTVDHFPVQCLCNSPECRHWITGYKDLPEHKKRECQNFVAPYLLEMEKEARLDPVSNVVVDREGVMTRNYSNPLFCRNVLATSSTVFF